jgi:hypothetical protein
LAQNEFNAEWEDKQNELTDTIEKLRKDIEDAETPSENDKLEKELEDAEKELAEHNEEEQRARRNKERGDWKDLRRNAENAPHDRTLSQYGWELLFVLGSLILSVGLLVVGFAGEPHERLICLILVAIVMIYIFMGGISVRVGG